MKILRNVAYALLSTLALTDASIAAAANAYPDKPIKLVVPFGAGGTTDLFGRLIGKALGDELKVAVVVENRAGAGGNIGSAQVARSPADGYTLLLGGAGHLVISPSLDPSFPFDPYKDLAPVMMVGTAMNVLVAHPSVPAKSVQELIDYARGKPGEVNFASGGKGGVIHLAGEMFARQAKVQLAHIPYKGSAAAYTDLVAGRVQIMFDNLPSALPYIRSGQVKAIAVTGAARSPQLPDVPTVSEQGLKGYEASSWWGVFAPAGTPAAIIAKLNDALVRGLAKYKEDIERLGADPSQGTPEGFAAIMRKDGDKWAEIIKSAGITLQ